MVQMTAKQARSAFSRLVKRAGHGETIAITHRGRRVAQIGPVASTPRGPLPDLSEFRKAIGGKGKPLSRIIVEERRAGRY